MNSEGIKWCFGGGRLNKYASERWFVADHWH
jgi:hypothetical protein